MSIETLAPDVEPGSESETTAALEEIRGNTTNEEKGGVLLFDKEEPSPAEERANQIYDNLMLTIQQIGEAAAEKASKWPQGETYETVLNEMTHVARVTRAFADDKIEFTHRTGYEQDRAAKGDKIYAYQANSVLIGDQEYDVRLNIRPEPFEKLARVGKELEFEEDREQRMRFDITPRHSGDKAVTIRVDPDEIITFDIVVPGIEEVDLKAAGQREGHHFPSGLAYKCSQASFAQILEAINRKVRVKEQPVSERTEGT